MKQLTMEEEMQRYEEDRDSMERRNNMELVLIKLIQRIDR